MDRQFLLEQVEKLRREGKSIRAIALELEIHPSRVQRALRSLGQDVVPASIPSSPAPGVFVGRQREMTLLDRALQNALSGTGSVVMVAGEPGIGKTRTVRELVTRAQRNDVSVFWGRCYEEPGAPPYWPWVQIIRSCIQRHHPRQIRSAMGIGAGDVAQIVPELKATLPEVEVPPCLEPEAARFRLFDSVTAFLKNFSRDRPTVLVLDNLHWADQASLLLLEFLASEAAETRLLVIGTYRDIGLSPQHFLSQTLGELIKYPDFLRISLNGLEPRDIHTLIELTAGVSPPQALTEAVHEQTQGNPLFITEVVKMLVHEGRLIETAVEGHPGSGWGIPEGVRDVIGRRLRGLSGECNHVMTIAALVGREFELGLLIRLLPGFPSEGFLPALEEALAAGIIEELSGSPGSYRFSHVLVQETLARELSFARRAQWHAEVGRALEELYGATAESHAAEIAYHFSQAASVANTEKVAHYWLLAGEQALAAYAHEEAVEHFLRGMAAIADQPIDAQSAALLFGLGRARLATLEPQEYHEALDNLNRAFGYYAEVGDVSQAVAVAQLPVQASPLSGHRTGMIKLIGRALALVLPDSHEAGRLLCQYGNTLYYESGDYHRARETFLRALSIAQREEDSALEMRILVAAGHAEAYQLNFQDTLGYDLRAIEMADRVNDPFEELHARQEVASVLHRTGDLEGSRRQAAAMLPIAERLRHRTRLWQALQANTTVAFLEGDWGTARNLSDRALSISPRNPNLLGYRSIIEFTLGEYDLGRAYLGRLLDVMGQATPGPTFEYVYPAIVVPLVGHMSGMVDQPQAAEMAAKAVLTSPTVTPVFTSLAQSGLALLAVNRSDQQAARELYGALQSYKGTMIGGPLDSIMSADRLLGLLAQTGGQVDAGAGHFKDALAFCRQSSYQPKLAWSLYEYAGLLFQRRTSDDYATGLSLLKESQQVSGMLGMCTLFDKVTARIDDAWVPGQAPAYPGGLTLREVEVLRLIASGRSNAGIASDLVLSIRTVERHVSNIYRKVAAHSRAEATAFAFTHDLMLESGL